MIALTSIPYRHSVNVDKLQLIRLFSDSLFAITLDQDPIADEIAIFEPIVTSDILDTIKYMIEYNNTPLVESRNNWYQAGKYLLMDVIIAMSDPNYLQIKQKTRLNLLDQYDLIRRYDYIMRFCIIYNASRIVKYIFDHTPMQQSDQMLYKDALLNCDFDIVKLFIDNRSIIPTDEDLRSVLEVKGCDNIVELLENISEPMT